MRPDISRPLRRFVRSLAGALPPPYDEAVLRAARIGRDLLSGSSAARGGGNVPRALRALDRGRLAALSLQAEAERKRGELTALVRTQQAMRRVQDSPALAAQQRTWLGRLVETDPRWLPWIPPLRDPFKARGENVVLHLLKESLPYRENGYTTRSWYTLRAQRELGLEPVVATALGFPRRDGVESIPPVEMVEGIRHHRLDLGPNYPLDLPFDTHVGDFAWLAAEVARAERPAVVHAASGFRGYDTALVALAIRERLGIPFVYEVRSFHEAAWSAEPELAARSEQFSRRFGAETRCMRAADAIVTIAEAMRDEIVDRGVSPDRVSVIPNAVDPTFFAPREADPELVRRYGLTGRTVFGYISNLDHPRENQELLIDATARLLRHGRAVTCLIVGDGRRREELERHARAASVGDAVVFTGAVPHAQVPAMYALMDVFVVPRTDDHASRHVTPLKPFEAMAMARPLVVTDLPALVEIAPPGERSVAFRAGDGAALAGAIESLIDHPELRERLGREGRRWVISERSWTRNAERYREIYDSLLRSRIERSPAAADAAEVG
jgi:glycosyltransferase involved in cell wall biosynthesis